MAFTFGLNSFNSGFMKIHLPQLFRVYGGMIILLAIFAQSMIPSGYMPAISKGKFFEITICQGSDQSTILVDDNMQPVQKHGQNDADHQENTPCLFTGMSLKYVAQQDFIFRQIEHLTYAQYVVRDMGQPVGVIPTKFYQGQAPPAHQQNA